MNTILAELGEGKYGLCATSSSSEAKPAPG